MRCMPFVFGLVAFTSTVHAQDDSGGDHFLDGIGETALIARYVFMNDVKDWSRNGLHATLHGDASVFVEDDQFGRALSLHGRDSGYVEIPGGALIGEDSLSVTAWVYLRSDAPEQRLFDFGRSVDSDFYCALSGDEAQGYRARITNGGKAKEQGTTTARIETGRWVHLAVVLDADQQTLTTYLDGVKAGQTADVTLRLDQVLNQESGEANRLYVGKSQDDNHPCLDAKLHDFRIYRIALSDQQVATIRNNALSGEVADASVDQPETEKEPPTAMETAVLPNASRLAHVPDIVVETVQGNLPRLPRFIPGAYVNDAHGPEVRVIWPLPTDNAQVREAGKYIVTGKVPGTKYQPTATVIVKAAGESAEIKPVRKLEEFTLGQVTLDLDELQRETPFIKNRDKFIRSLAQTNPDRFLYMFRDAFGQEQPEGAEALHVWDSQTTKLRGHATGHYLSALAQAYASASYNKELQATFLQKMNDMIDVLYDLSRKSGKPTEDGGEFNADPTSVPPGPGKTDYDSDLSVDGIRTDYWNWGEGFISAYPPDQFIMLERGATYGTQDSQVWAPYYTLHKIFAGLMDCYEVGGNEKALEIARGMGLWVYRRLQALPESTRISMWNRYIAGEYGGMNEAMARLYRITDDERLLECAKLFDNISFFFGDAEHAHGLACNVDTIRGKHANQHIPQITGALATYRATQDADYFRVADNFWDICSHDYMYSIGGVAGAKNPNNAECFTAQPNSLYENGFSSGGQNETCATYNLLKLSRRLFMYDPDAKYMDYYERALYNHILASVAEHDPGNTYHVPLNPGARKQFSNAHMDGFTCCNGTALESNTKLQNTIYLKSADNGALYVNLFVPSTLNWTERGVVVKQRTSFPYEDTTRLIITGKGEFDIMLRRPNWATKGFQVKINGEEQTVDVAPGAYLRLHRAWQDNDTIEIRMPFHFYLRPVMDQPNIASLFYGPVLLAAQEPSPRTDWRAVTLDADDIGKSIEGDPATLRFNIDGVEYIPFYETFGRHSVYLNVTLE